MGIVNSGIPDLSLSINIKGVKFENSIKSINKWVDFLKNENVNTIIVLTSSGIPWDREEEYDEYNKKISDGLIDPYNMNLNAIQMGRYIEHVDIIISGGVSKGMIRHGMIPIVMFIFFKIMGMVLALVIFHFLTIVILKFLRVIAQ